MGSYVKKTKKSAVCFVVKRYFQSRPPKGQKLYCPPSFDVWIPKGYFLA